MKWHCKECGRLSLRLNKEEECPECARKDEALKSYFTKLLLHQRRLRETGAGHLILPPFVCVARFPPGLYRPKGYPCAYQFINFTLSVLSAPNYLVTQSTDYCSLPPRGRTNN